MKRRLISKRGIVEPYNIIDFDGINSGLLSTGKSGGFSTIEMEILINSYSTKTNIFQFRANGTSNRILCAINSTLVDVIEQPSASVTGAPSPSLSNFFTLKIQYGSTTNIYIDNVLIGTGSAHTGSLTFDEINLYLFNNIGFSAPRQGQIKALKLDSEVFNFNGSGDLIGDQGTIFTFIGAGTTWQTI